MPKVKKKPASEKAIYITDHDLSVAMERLGKRQTVPVKRSTMARAILQSVVRGCGKTDDPESWKHPLDR